MTDSDFLRALLADPNDTSLRLVYADWLEDQDDIRHSAFMLHWGSFRASHK